MSIIDGVVTPDNTFSKNSHLRLSSMMNNNNSMPSCQDTELFELLNQQGFPIEHPPKEKLDKKIEWIIAFNRKRLLDKEIKNMKWNLA